MRTSRATQLGGIAVLMAVVACGGGNGGGGNGPPQIPPVTPTQDVGIINNAFNPPNAGVSAGSSVTWTWNSGGQDHNVRWASGPTPLPMDSPTQNSGTFVQTFNNPGMYHYVCSIHQNMEGYVTVQ